MINDYQGAASIPISTDAEKRMQNIKTYLTKVIDFIPYELNMIGRIKWIKPDVNSHYYSTSIDDVNKVLNEGEDFEGYELGVSCYGVFSFSIRYKLFEPVVVESNMVYLN